MTHVDYIGDNDQMGLNALTTDFHGGEFVYLWKQASQSVLKFGTLIALNLDSKKEVG